MSMALRRRSFLAAAGAGGLVVPLARPAIAQPARVLKAVPQANLTSIDPIWTTANITRNYGHMVYDTLYGIDQNFVAQPQMAAGQGGDLDSTLSFQAGALPAAGHFSADVRGARVE